MEEALQRGNRQQASCAPPGPIEAPQLASVIWQVEVWKPFVRQAQVPCWQRASIVVPLIDPEGLQDT